MIDPITKGGHENYNRETNLLDCKRKEKEFPHYKDKRTLGQFKLTE